VLKTAVALAAACACLAHASQVPTETDAATELPELTNTATRAGRRVDELGRAGQVLLAASSGWRLFDDAAMAQARRCPFHPAQRGSEPVGSWVEFSVRFALESSSNG
jgi:hypothetical protein